MALTREAWDKIKMQVCLDDNLVHEDQDISCLLVENGLRATINYRMLITASEKEMLNWPKLYEYIKRRQKTKQLHAMRLKAESVRRIGLVETVLKRGLTIIPEALFLVTSYLFFQAKKLHLGERK